MSKSSELDKTVKSYILECIEEDGEGNPIATTADKIAYLKQRFNSEYAYNIKRLGALKACTDWLQGLALNIEFTNYEILELAKSWGSLADDATEKQEDAIISNYWHFMANKCLQLMNGYRVPK